MPVPIAESEFAVMLVTGGGCSSKASAKAPRCRPKVCAEFRDSAARHRTTAALGGLVWILFAGALLLATAPVWRLWALGFNRTLDELLQIAICGGPLKK
jgi:hypothetical protein